MTSGGYWKTTNSQITAHWPLQGGSRDFGMWSRIGVWISQNEKVLNKRTQDEVCRLVSEQFPELVEVESRDYSGRLARWRK
jgi:hypothetical protein